MKSKYLYRLLLVVPVLLVVLSLSSCKSKSDDSKLIAEVGDADLYLSEIGFLFEGKIFSSEDSAKIIKKYATEWVEEQLIIQTAASSDKVNQKEIERKTADFKNDLLIHALLNAEIELQLDTAVSEEELDTYYKNHQHDFQLNDYLVKVLYLKIPIDAPDIEKIGSAYKLNKESNLETIEVYAKKYASNFYYDIESWIYFDDLLKEIPLHDINKDSFILKRSKIRFEENGFYYFLNIVDYKLKNSTSPLSFEKENIKARIINERIKTLRIAIEQDLINKGYNENEVNIY